MSPNERMEGGVNNPVALYLNDEWVITFDAHQWIVCKARKLRSERKLHPQAYIGSTKSVLARVLREKGVQVDPAAQSRLDTWPERFLDWINLQIEARAA